MSRTLNLTMNVTDEEFASLVARFADRAVLSTSDGSNTLSIPAAGATDDDDEDNTVSTAATGLDSAGVPWIEGVHSSSKKQNADGTWRLMKGVDKDKAAAAIAAAKQPSAPVTPVYAAPIPAPTEQTAPVTSFVPPVATPAPAPVGLPGMPGIPTPAPIPAPVQDVPVSYQEVIDKATKLSAAGIPNDVFAGVYAAAGVTDVNALINDETLRRSLMTELNKLG